MGLLNSLFGSGKKEVKPTIYTEQTCNSCGDVVKRPFEDGDHVFKPGLACGKCSATTLITAVYGQYPPEKH